MSDSKFQSPSDDDLRIIHKHVPGLAQQTQDRLLERTAKIAGVKPGDRLCNICTNKIIVISKNPSGFCIDCEKKLEEGQTAVVCIDGRHLFIQSKVGVEGEKDMFVAITMNLPKVWPENFTIRGQVIGTPPETMDKLVQMFEAKKAQEN